MPGIDAAQRASLEKPPVTTTQLVMYAGASGDFNRIHFDLPFAREAGLDGVIAHGMLTMGFAAQLLAQMAGPGGFVKRVEARFQSPVKPGNVVRIEAEVACAPQAGRAQAEVHFRGTVGEREVIAGSGTLARLEGRFPA
jgi:acyl dehydratase